MRCEARALKALQSLKLRRQDGHKGLEAAEGPQNPAQLSSCVLSC